MKTAKKLSALLMALLMVTALSVTAFAAMDGSTITVRPKEAVEHTYTAYQIFAGDLSTDSLLSTVTWANNTVAGNAADILAALKADSTIGDIFSGITTSNLSAAAVADAIADAKIVNDSDKAQALADVFETLAKDGKLGMGTPLNKAEGETNYFLDVDPGYYLVLDASDEDNAHLSRPVLTVAGDAVIDPKVGEDVPTVIKVADGISYGIGDTIPYTVTYTPADFDSAANEAETPDALYQYDFNLTDNLGVNLEPGFTTQANTGVVNSGVKVYLGTVDAGHDITAEFLITYNAQNKTLTVYSADISELEGISSTTPIIVKYSAKIVTAGYDPTEPVVNNVRVNGTAVVPEYVYPVNLTVQKVDGADVTKLLAGAEFQLYREVNGETQYAMVNADTMNVVGWTANEAQAYTLVTGSTLVEGEETDGTFTVYGLAAGTYYLKETKAPGNYNKLDAPVELKITVTENAVGDGVASVTITVDGEATTTVAGDTATAVVKNNTGATLPSTGGMGTTIFYVVGAILVAGAVVLLITRKRMNEE